MNQGSSAQSAGLNRSAEDSSSSLQSRLRWFLVLTKPAREGIAQSNLERQGYRVYYPRLLRPSLWRGQWIERAVSLFPRYLFVQLDSSRQSLGPVASTLGVSRLVRFGHDSAVVPDEVVERLILKADPQSGLHRLGKGRRFQREERINIIAGVFEGLEGIFEREAGEERVIILLGLLGRQAMVRVPSRHVVPAGPGK